MIRILWWMLAFAVLAIFAAPAKSESVDPFTMYRDEYLNEKPLYWDGNPPCSNIAAYFNAMPTRLADYTKPSYDVDPTFGPGCRYELIERAGSGYPAGTITHVFAQNWVEPVHVCPDGYTLSTDYTVAPSRELCTRHEPPTVQHPPCCDDGFGVGPLTAGNPINFGTGSKVQIETDYTGPGDARLNFQRYYRSGLWPYLRSKIGANWSHSFSRQLFYLGAGTYPIGVADPSGHWTWFKASGSTFVSIYHPADTISKVTVGTSFEWHRHKPNDGVEVYDAAGRNTRIETREGRFLTLTYDPQSRLATVDTEYGRGLDFTYGSNGYISRVDLPDGNALVYDYSTTDAQPRLLAVHYPGNTKKNYTYDGAGQLTGIIDENGVAVETITYNSYGKAIATTLIGGLNRYAYTGAAAGELPKLWGADGAGGTYDLVTPLGATVRITTINVKGSVLPATISAACPECGVDGSALTYDPNGAVLTRADFSGKKTCYRYDTARNLETVRAENILVAESCATVLATLPARADVRKITTQWHPTLRVPIKVAEPNQMTTNAYNGDGGVYCAPASARGVLCKQTIRDTTDPTGQQGFAAAYTGLPRVWQHTYNKFGQELTSTDPNGDITNTTYSANGTMQTEGKPGDMITVTASDGSGRMLALHDASGDAMTLTYWPRGWLRTLTHAGSTMNFTYDNVGQLTKALYGDGRFVLYVYDAAHRLVQMQDERGRKIVFTLDAAGTRIAKATYDETGKRVQAINDDGTDQRKGTLALRRHAMFAWYGNWCGPDWTGGFVREYGQIGPGDDILPPIDALDRCCYTHDVCYWQCRCDNGCTPGARALCFWVCDRQLASCAESVGERRSMVFWYFSHSDPDPDHNAFTCPQVKKK